MSDHTPPRKHKTQGFLQTLAIRSGGRDVRDADLSAAAKARCQAIDAARTDWTAGLEDAKRSFAEARDTARDLHQIKETVATASGCP